MNNSTYVFIVAFGRSGSTVLSRLMAEYDGFVSVGEFFPGIVYRNPDLQCSCGERVEDCEFYRSIFSRLSDEEKEVIRQGDIIVNSMGLREKLLLYPSSNSIVRGIQKALLPKTLNSYVEIIRGMQDFILEKENAKVFIDASKQFYILNLYLLAGIKNIKVVHLKRSPLGMYASRKRSHDLNIEKFVSAYNRYNSINTSFKDFKGVESYHELYYEDFVANHENAMESLLTFIGHETSKIPVNKKLHIGGNSSRHSAEIKLTLDERWKSELTTQEQEFIQKNIRYRYPNMT